jgi:hypothetical protein
MMEFHGLIATYNQNAACVEVFCTSLAALILCRTARSVMKGTNTQKKPMTGRKRVHHAVRIESLGGKWIKRVFVRAIRK